MGSLREDNHTLTLPERQEMLRTHRMEALGALTAGVAHDFSTVLQIVSGSAALIRDSLEDRGAVERLIIILEQVAQRGASLINRLMFIARVDPEHAEPTDVAHVLRGVSQIFVHTITRDITIEVETPDPLPLVRVDRAELETALINIAVNARQAMPNGGSFKLRATAVPREDGAAGSAETSPRLYVRIDAIDTGTGMAPETLARAKDWFFTTKPAHEGTGLGLAMADELAKRFGGHFSIESELHRGTTVSLWLPADRDEPPITLPVQAYRADPRAVPGALASPCLQHLVLLDDDELVRNVLTRQLRREGIKVTVVENALQLFDVLASRQDIDALVTDYHMPGISGDRLIARARAMRPRLVVAVLTGSLPNAGHLATQWDNLVAIAKPAGPRHIIERVEAALRQRSVIEMAARYVL